ncbi:MAG: dihydrolipoamide acetyltransferase family protein [Pseudomonadota bacterium]
MEAQAVKLPDVGEGVTEAELAEWHVEVGDLVREDDVIAAVMTDKATVEIPSLYSGRVIWRAGEIGESVPVGADLVRIETADVAKPSSRESVPAPDQTHAAAPADADPRPAPAAASKPQNHDKPASPERASAAISRLPRQAPLASPFVRAKAREAGIDLRRVAGSGPAGRILQSDLDAALTGGGTPDATSRSARMARSGIEEIQVIGLRRKIAERMALANSRIPHITVVEEVDVTALEDLRNTMNATRGDRPNLTVLPFITAALCRAVLDHPEMNAHYLDDDDKVLRFGAVNVGIATMTETGLVVPVLKNAEARGPFDLAAEIARLSEAAREGKASRDALTGSSITITSLGPLGAVATTPIINHPEVAIVGVNKMAVRPHWDGAQFVPRTMMNLSSSFDHRVIDGWDAARFVQTMKRLLETPALIFVEG